MPDQVPEMRCPNCGTLITRINHGWLPQHRDRALESKVVTMREAGYVWRVIAEEANVSPARVRKVYERWLMEENT